MRSEDGRQRTTTPLSSCPEDSWSLPRKTMKSLSRLREVSDLCNGTSSDVLCRAVT